VTEQVWDDEAFRRRLNDYAARCGRSVREVLHSVDLAPDFGERSVRMRSTNAIMLVARALDVSPCMLAGWDDHS
jgi:hypothetical protein